MEDNHLWKYVETWKASDKSKLKFGKQSEGPAWYITFFKGRLADPSLQ
jgi:hypothetical protein